MERLCSDDLLSAEPFSRVLCDDPLDERLFSHELCRRKLFAIFVMLELYLVRTRNMSKFMFTHLSPILLLSSSFCMDVGIRLSLAETLPSILSLYKKI